MFPRTVKVALYHELHTFQTVSISLKRDEFFNWIELCEICRYDDAIFLV